MPAAIQELAKRRGAEEEKKKKKGRRTILKSNNPHLAGGKKSPKTRAKRATDDLQSLHYGSHMNQSSQNHK